MPVGTECEVQNVRSNGDEIKCLDEWWFSNGFELAETRFQLQNAFNFRADCIAELNRDRDKMTDLDIFAECLTIEESQVKELSKEFGLPCYKVESITIDCCQNTNDKDTIAQIFNDYQGDEKLAASWFKSYVRDSIIERIEDESIAAL